MRFKLIIGLILAAVVALFILQNVTTMELTFLFWTLSMSRALLMFLILSIGILLGWLLHGSFRKIKTTPSEKNHKKE
jgi:lipopolysaccharide assembly protein A